MDYEKKYKEALEKLQEALTPTEDGCKISGLTRGCIENIFPELAESEDERIRNEIARFIQMEVEDEIVGNKWIAWLKKQESVGEIVERYKNSWYNEGKIAGMTEGLTDDEKYQQGWHDALEKQGEQKPIINVPSREVILAIWDLGNEWKELTNGSISTEYGTQLYYIQKHWHESEYYLQKKQGEQKSAEWHKGDEQNLNACLGYIPDECLRRWLMDVIHVKYDKPTDKVESKDYSSIDPHFGKPIDKMPTDKVETKFHKGQWIVWQDECYKVNYNGCGYELVDKNGLSILLDYGTIDENAHLWDVAKDAKSGNVLYSQKHNLIWIYKDNKHYYASINLNYADGISFDGDIVIPSDVCPATKEQRDTLMKAMADAGYTFDFDKKELKKIEKKFNVGDEIKTANEEPLAITKIDEKGYWSEDLFICDFDDAAKWELVEQKPSWSKEDEIALGNALWCCKQAASIAKDENDMGNVWYAEHWLKSLRPQNRWKPSNEQMKALHHLNLTGNISYAGQGQTLIELYNDLKKLKVEKLKKNNYDKET